MRITQLPGSDAGPYDSEVAWTSCISSGAARENVLDDRCMKKQRTTPTRARSLERPNGGIYAFKEMILFKNTVVDVFKNTVVDVRLAENITSNVVY
jgi:hypothetical protein